MLRQRLWWALHGAAFETTYLLEKLPVLYFSLKKSINGFCIAGFKIFPFLFKPGVPLSF